MKMSKKDMLKRLKKEMNGVSKVIPESMGKMNVTVSSDSPEGLQEGLEEAKSLSERLLEARRKEKKKGKKEKKSEGSEYACGGVKSDLSKALKSRKK